MEFSNKPVIVNVPMLKRTTTCLNQCMTFHDIVFAHYKSIHIWSSICYMLVYFSIKVQKQFITQFCKILQLQKFFAIVLQCHPKCMIALQCHHNYLSFLLSLIELFPPHYLSHISLSLSLSLSFSLSLLFKACTRAGLDSEWSRHGDWRDNGVVMAWRRSAWILDRLGSVEIRDRGGMDLD